MSPSNHKLWKTTSFTFETFDESRTTAACGLKPEIGEVGQAIYLTITDTWWIWHSVFAVMRSGFTNYIHRTQFRRIAAFSATGADACFCHDVKLPHRRC